MNKTQECKECEYLKLVNPKNSICEYHQGKLQAQKDILRFIEFAENNSDWICDRQVKFKIIQAQNQSPNKSDNTMCICGHLKYGHHLFMTGNYGKCKIDNCNCRKFKQEGTK